MQITLIYCGAGVSRVFDKLNDTTSLRYFGTTRVYVYL